MWSLFYGKSRMVNALYIWFATEQHLQGAWWGKGQGIWTRNELGLRRVKEAAGEGIIYSYDALRTILALNSNVVWLSRSPANPITGSWQPPRGSEGCSSIGIGRDGCWLNIRKDEQRTFNAWFYCCDIDSMLGILWVVSCKEQIDLHLSEFLIWEAYGFLLFFNLLSGLSFWA